MSLTVLNKDGSVMGSTRNLNLESYQNPYASQPQTPPFGRVNSTAAMPKPTPGQGGIPQDAIFRSATPSTGGTKSPDMSIYSPGRAQPVQSQSTGTPYGVYAPGTTAADIAKQPYTDHMQPNPLYGKYAPGTTAADIAQQPYTDVMTPNPSYAGSARPQAPQRFDGVLAADAPWWAGELGNLPHNPADNRPAYGPTGTATGANAGNFQPSAPAPQNPFANMAPGVYYGGQQIPGNQQQALATAMAQRDAMSVLVNNNNLQYQMANAFGQDLGRPQFDYGSAMQQAQNMVANGFYNPFTQYYNQATDPMNQLGQYAPPTMYNPQPFAPIGGFGVQPPPAPPQAQPEYSYKQVPGSEWDQVQQAWRLPAKPVTQAPFAPPPTPTRAEPPVPRVSPTTPTSGNWIQRPDGQWEETQPKMYGGPDPVLKAPQWKPMYGEYSPTQFYDDNGRAFGGSMSFAPGASAEYQENAYRQFAERMGYYKRDANGNRVGTQPGPRSAPEPRPGPILIDPRSAPGQAQPIQTPSQGTPYGGAEKKPAGTVATAPLANDDRSRMEAIGAALRTPDVKRALISYGDRARQQAMGGSVQFTAEELQAKKQADELQDLQAKMMRLDDAGFAERGRRGDEIRKAAFAKHERDAWKAQADEFVRRSLTNALVAGVNTLPTDLQKAMLSNYARGERGTPGASLEDAIRATGWKGPLIFTGQWSLD